MLPGRLTCGGLNVIVSVVMADIITIIFNCFFLMGLYISLLFVWLVSVRA